MANRAVSPHEKAFLQRQSQGRFNVDATTLPKKSKKAPLGYKPMMARMMESSGRRSLVPGQKPPAASRASR